MMRTARALAAVVAATALTLTGAHTADAKPAHAKSAPSEKAAKGGKGAMSKLEREVARKVAQLENTVSDQRLRRVPTEQSEVVKERVAADQEALRALVAPAPAEPVAGETAEVTDVRAALKSYRVENYRLVVNILRKAATVGETTDAETAALDEAVALALAITATSAKADVKDARAALEEAADLLEDDADEAEEADDADDADDAEDETELEAPEGDAGDDAGDDSTGTETGETVTP